MINKRKRGFSIIEVILAGSILALIVFGVVSAWLYGEQALVKAGDRGRGIAIASEGIEIARNMRDVDFGKLTDGSYALTNTGTSWMLTPDEKEVIGNYRRYLVIASEDSSTRTITSTVEWTGVDGRPASFSTSSLLTNWQQTRRPTKKPNAGPIISNVVASPSLFGATITWRTNVPSSSRVQYGLTASYSSTTAVTDVDPRVLEHEVQITNLTPDTIYHFRVRSIDSANRESFSLNYTFTTAADEDPPEITNITVTPFETHAYIEWDTDEASSTFVEYGLTDDLGEETNEVDTSPHVTHHDVDIPNLLPDTLYYFRVNSRDMNGNLATSDIDIFFTTAGGPTISNLTVVVRSTTYVTLSWDTDEVTNAQIFDFNNSLQSPLVDTNPMTLNHTVTISGLPPCTQVDLTARSIDSDDNPSQDEVVSLTTRGCPPTWVTSFDAQISDIGRIAVRPAQVGGTDVSVVYAVDTNPGNPAMSAFSVGTDGNISSEHHLGPGEFFSWGDQGAPIVDIAAIDQWVYILSTDSENPLTIFTAENPAFPEFNARTNFDPAHTENAEPKALHVKKMMINDTEHWVMFVALEGRITVYDISANDQPGDPTSWELLGNILRPEITEYALNASDLYLSNQVVNNARKLSIITRDGAIFRADIYNNGSVQSPADDPLEFPYNYETPYIVSNQENNRWIASGRSGGLLHLPEDANSFTATGVGTNPRAISDTSSIEGYMFLSRYDLTGNSEYFQMLQSTADDELVVVAGVNLAQFYSGSPYAQEDISTTVGFLEDVHYVFISRLNRIVIIDPGV